jgi:hypothetical protein
MEKYEMAIKLLKEIGCPEEILTALDIFKMFVRRDEIKLHNWQALSGPGVIEGEGREIEPIENLE